ncbi:Acid stress protein IbaG [Buchnera aphidicola (Thelaxes suberi)]|uniref:BolA/IbaG family iron-sulfur metabolism protein n=1 Tax=Buchnera aphidicola TaxID=9 RepID=UPI0034647176
MIIKKIKKIIQEKISLQEIYVEGDENNIKIIAVDKIFHNMNSLQRQKIIYAPLTVYITNKTIHAINIYTFTPEEWKKKSKKISF